MGYLPKYQVERKKNPPIYDIGLCLYLLLIFTNRKSVFRKIERKKKKERNVFCKTIILQYGYYATFEKLLRKYPKTRPNVINKYFFFFSRKIVYSVYNVRRRSVMQCIQIQLSMSLHAFLFRILHVPGEHSVQVFSLQDSCLCTRGIHRIDKKKFSVLKTVSRGQQPREYIFSMASNILYARPITNRIIRR